MSTCSLCGNSLPEDKSIIIEKNGLTQKYCCPNCLFVSNTFENYKHQSISSLVLNKTLFEILAIMTGFGGVYYTIFNVARRALIMDTVSLVTALAALFIGIEHLRYVEEHNLVRRVIVFLSILILAIFTIIVWHYGIR